MNADEIRKLDEETLEKLTEGIGPSDECLCSILSPPEREKKGLRNSIKKAFASLGQVRPGRSAPKQRRMPAGLQNTVDVPLTFTKGGEGIYTTKETVKGDPNCKKCSCANENIVLKHSFANIRISTPDISNFCSCPSDCLPDKAKLTNNIKVTIERLAVDIPLIPEPDRGLEGKGSAEMDSGELLSLDSLSTSSHNGAELTEDN